MLLSSDNYLIRCQQAGWKEHKKWCGQGQQLSLEDIRRRVNDAADSNNWDEVLRWESRIIELVQNQEAMTVLGIYSSFLFGFIHTRQPDKAGDMYGMCAGVAGACHKFSQQVIELYSAASCYVSASNFSSGASSYEKARDISAQHGFGLMEAKICGELGRLFREEGRFTEALAEVRRARQVAENLLNDNAPRWTDNLRAQVTGRILHSREDPPYFQLASRRDLVDALCSVGNLAEAEALFLRIQEGGWDTADCRLWNNYLRGTILVSRGSFDDGAEALQAAVDVTVHHPDVLQDDNANNALRMAKNRLKVYGRAGDAPSLHSVFEAVQQSERAHDWAGVLRCESRMEELLPTCSLPSRQRLLSSFAQANSLAGHKAKATSLYERCVVVAGTRGRFRDQASFMCDAGKSFLELDNAEGASKFFLKARDLGAQHGFSIPILHPNPRNPKPLTQYTNPQTLIPNP